MKKKREQTTLYYVDSKIAFSRYLLKNRGMKTEQGVACWKANEMGMWRRKKKDEENF